MAKNTKRFDQRAMLAIVAAVRANKRIMIEFESEAQATYHRHQFYAWRSAVAAIDDELDCQDIVVKKDGMALIYEGGFATADLRAAMGRAGIVVGE